jgi:sec-independent protein translocase protein TatC
MEFGGLIRGFRARSGEATLLDRLDNFRDRLITSLVVVIIATGVGFYISITFDVLGIVTAPIEPFLNGERLKYLSPTDPFFITLKLAVILGLILSLPYLLIQLWGLVSPLMRPDERRLVKPAIAAGVLLFAVGSVFCYFMVLPLMLRFTMGFQAGSLEEWIVIDRYLKIVVRLVAAFGFAFELPIVILIGTLLGIVTPELLAAKRRHAIAAFTIASAIVTPPDLSSMILLLVPVYLLYEGSIVMSRAVLARRPALAAEAEG